MFWFSSFSASYSNRASLLARRPRFQQQQRRAGRRLARFLWLLSASVTTEEKLTATTCRRHSPRQCMAQSTSHAAARWKVQQEISAAFFFVRLKCRHEPLSTNKRSPFVFAFNQLTNLVTCLQYNKLGAFRIDYGLTIRWREGCSNHLKDKPTRSLKKLDTLL